MLAQTSSGLASAQLCSNEQHTAASLALAASEQVPGASVSEAGSSLLPAAVGKRWALSDSAKTITSD